MADRDRWETDERWRRWRDEDDARYGPKGYPGYYRGYGPRGGYGPGGYIGGYYDPSYDRGFYSRDRDPYTGYGPYYGRRDHDDRGFFDRTADEVASWFGDEDAERRRQTDEIYGPYRGRGPKGYRRSDDRIREDVSDRLTDDPWLDASDMEVGVGDSVVTLSGTVNSRADKRRAEDLAERVSGVFDVQNQLRLRPREDSGATTPGSGADRASTAGRQT